MLLQILAGVGLLVLGAVLISIMCPTLGSVSAPPLMSRRRRLSVIWTPRGLLRQLLSALAEFFLHFVTRGRRHRSLVPGRLLLLRPRPRSPLSAGESVPHFVGAIQQISSITPPKYEGRTGAGHWSAQGHTGELQTRPSDCCREVLLPLLCSNSPPELLSSN